MKRPTPEQARALASIRNLPEATSYVRDCLEETKDALVKAEDVAALRILQGKAAAYRDLLKYIEA